MFIFVCLYDCVSVCHINKKRQKYLFFLFVAFKHYLYFHFCSTKYYNNYVPLSSPFKVFYGSGVNLELSEIDAAAKALLSIADSGIEEESIEENDQDAIKKN